MQESNEIKKRYYTQMQRDIILADPKELFCVAGRGTGKSTKVMASLSAKRAFDMPGGCFSFTGATYAQLQQRTIPSVVGGWADLGYKEGVHWCVGKPKPGWAQPLFTPLDYSKCISWYTGTNFIFCSLDRSGMTNSYTFSGIFGDEAKTFNYEIWKEDLLPTLRAPLTLFPNSAHNRSLILTTSMPSIPDGQWILDMEKRQNPETVKMILKYAEQLEAVKYLYFNSKTESTKQKYLSQIRLREKHLMELRKRCVMYIEASTFSVVDILELGYIEQQEQLLGENFKSEILNIRPTGTKIMFYNGLGKRHFYTNFNYDFIDSFGSLHDERSVNCLRDKDYNPLLPLTIGVDFGVTFNCIVVAQDDVARNELRAINNFYVENGGVISEVVNKLCDYYQHAKVKHVIVHFDNSGNNRQSIVKQTPAQELQLNFQSRAWSVDLRTKGGSNSSHHAKYWMWQNALTFKPGFPKLMINQANCEETVYSMQYAGAYKDWKGYFHKNKSSEKSTGSQVYATHLSDAFDTIIRDKYKIGNHSSGTAHL